MANKTDELINAGILGHPPLLCLALVCCWIEILESTISMSPNVLVVPKSLVRNLGTFVNDSGTCTDFNHNI